MNEYVETIRLAAKKRQEHYSGAKLLDWSELTDAQKLPWLIRAWNTRYAGPEDAK